jgi:hypothetical protein
LTVPVLDAALWFKWLRINLSKIGFVLAVEGKILVSKIYST